MVVPPLLPMKRALSESHDSVSELSASLTWAMELARGPQQATQIADPPRIVTLCLKKQAGILAVTVYRTMNT